MMKSERLMGTHHVLNNYVGNLLQLVQTAKRKHGMERSTLSFYDFDQSF